MDIMNWSIQTSVPGYITIVISEYVLNELGVFIKQEYRVLKKNKINAVMGFRIGYEPVPNTDYRAARGNRNAILWHKITNIVQDGDNKLIINGNKEDVIELVFENEMRESIYNYIADMQELHPTEMGADEKAVAWMCWRDDDEWDDDFEPLLDMIEAELKVKRYIESDILEETVLKNVAETARLKVNITSVPVEKVSVRPSFCSSCGESLDEDGDFCANCGARIE